MDVEQRERERGKEKLECLDGGMTPELDAWLCAWDRGIWVCMRRWPYFV